MDPETPQADGQRQGGLREDPRTRRDGLPHLRREDSKPPRPRLRPCRPALERRPALRGERPPLTPPLQPSEGEQGLAERERAGRRNPPSRYHGLAWVSSRPGSRRCACAPPTPARSACTCPRPPVARPAHGRRPSGGTPVAWNACATLPAISRSKSPIPWTPRPSSPLAILVSSAWTTAFPSSAAILSRTGR